MKAVTKVVGSPMIDGARTVCRALLLSAFWITAAATRALIGEARAAADRDMPQKPAGLDDAGWASLQQAIGKSIGQQAKLAGDGSLAGADGAASDQFGWSVALSGDTALVGAYLDDVGANSDQGSAYVYVRSGTTWTQQAKLTAGDGAANDQFGSAVALSGDIALVGALADDVGANGDQGSAYVYTRSGTTWTQQAQLVAGDGAANDQFGWSVALSGDTALVGAFLDDVGANIDQGSAYVYTRTGTAWTQQAQLVAGDGAANDQFGRSVALSGDTALVGVPSDDVGANSNQGSAYVYTRSGTTWMQQAKLTAGDGAAFDLFGYSVALSGDTALLGALFDDVGDNSNQGSAYVYTRTGTTWTQQAKLTAGDGAAFDQFGWSVALSGNTALVSAYRDDIAANSDQGSAYVYARTGTTWTQQAKLVAGDGAAGDLFGYSVALSGDTALVGSRLDAVGPNGQQGSAYVYIRSGTTWMQQVQLTAGDGAANDEFGYAVALSGDTALVGARLEGVGTNTNQGSAYVFIRSGTLWTQQAKLTAGDGAANDQFGYSVALSGDTALLGARLDDVGVNSNQGSAYVYIRSGTAWTQQAKLTADDGAANDQLGHSVALSGDTALVGANRDNSNQGSAYVYIRSGTTWTQQARLVAGDGAASDFFGHSVALSGDTALVGAYIDAVGTNNGQGSAYVYIRSGATWTQQAKLTAGDGAANDQFGWSVALSGDTALVGAFADDIGANGDQGSAYVYIRSGTTWTQQAQLVAGDGVVNDFFGRSVALSGSTALVGAEGVDGPAPFGNPNEGAAYVYIGIGPQASTTTLTSALPDPSQVGQSVVIDVSVSGTTSAAPDGVVTVTASTGESCTDNTPAPGSGTTTLFACSITFSTVGPRTLTASFSDSVTHTDSASAAEPHAVITTLNVSPASLPGGTFGVPYSELVSASGAGSTAPYSYAVSSGALPAGLSLLVASDLVSGTPSAAGSYSFEITAIDSSAPAVGGPFTGTRAYTIEIARANQLALTAIATPPSINFAGTSALSSSGGSGTGAVSYAVTAGETFCEVSGSTLTGTGVGTCTVTATKAADANYNATSATVDVTVLAATDLEVSKTDGTPWAVPDAFVVYEILAANAGPLGVTGARLEDPLPTGLADALWTCAPVQNATCPAPSGTGGIDQLVDLPVGGVLRYEFTARVTAALGATVTNTVTISPPVDVLETEAADNTASDMNTVVPDGLFINGFETPSRGISVPLQQ